MTGQLTMPPAPAEPVHTPYAAGAGPHVIGLDLSLRSTGLATSDGLCQLITGPALPRKATYQARSDRIWDMREEVIDTVLAGPGPALIVIEGPAYRANDPSMFDRAALWHWIYRALGDPYRFAVMTPAALKKYATGKGIASKGAVTDAVIRRWPQWNHAGDDNVVDAVVLMAAGRDWLGASLTPMPQTHRAALDKVDWPKIGDQLNRDPMHVVADQAKQLLDLAEAARG